MDTREYIRNKIRGLSEQIYLTKQKSLTFDTFENIKTTISPAHDNWKFYASYKKEVSFWLTALNILKRFNYQIPDKTELVKAIDQGLFKHHCKKNNLAYKAYRYLVKLDNKLQKENKKAACAA